MGPLLRGRNPQKGCNVNISWKKETKMWDDQEFSELVLFRASEFDEKGG